LTCPQRESKGKRREKKKRREKGTFYFIGGREKGTFYFIGTLSRQKWHEIQPNASQKVECPLFAPFAVDDRPDRYEPRLLKRRLKKYKHLREPRANYKTRAA